MAHKPFYQSIWAGPTFLLLGERSEFLYVSQHILPANIDAVVPFVTTINYYPNSRHSTTKSINHPDSTQGTSVHIIAVLVCFSDAVNNQQISFMDGLCFNKLQTFSTTVV